MLGLGVGRIVTISSASAQMGGGTYSKVAYSAAKAGVLGFTRALAREVGKQGVTVNSVSPGPIDTDIMGGPLSEQRIEEIRAGLVVDRVGTVQDVAALFEFLMGPDAGFITGATYNVNGGLIID
jgi:NAD(P)-dependent dehydrogenase (short-subunit alcohol dehydrogenase family)